MRLLAVLFLLALPVWAGAGPVTYHFTGTVQHVTSGSPDSLDLGGTVHVGDPAVIDVTIDPATPGKCEASLCFYSPSIGLSASFGGYTCTGDSISQATVLDGESFYDFDGTLYHHSDSFAYADGRVAAPYIGTARLTQLLVDLIDPDSTALHSTVLPIPMPDASEFEVRYFRLDFADTTSPKKGFVYGSLDGILTPAFGESWGALKARYRR